MVELIAENAFMRLLLLIALFGIVSAGAYLLVAEFTTRQTTRRRLVNESPQAGQEAGYVGSLRSDHAASTWLKLVNAVEKSGLSLVDTKDDAVRQRLIAAGFPAPYAPRLYTLARLALIVVLPLLVLAF